MRKYLVPVLVAIIGFLGLNVLTSGMGATADDGPAYAQASASFSQSEGGVIIIDTLDEANGIDLVGDGEFQVADPGAYLVVLAPQVGGVEGAAGGEARFWLEVSRDYGVSWTQVPNSNVLWTSAQKSDGDVIISQGVMFLDSGDSVRGMWSTQGPHIEALFRDGEPLVPAVIATVARVGA